MADETESKLPPLPDAKGVIDKMLTALWAPSKSMAAAGERALAAQREHQPDATTEQIVFYVWTAMVGQMQNELAGFPAYPRAPSPKQEPTS